MSNLNDLDMKPNVEHENVEVEMKPEVKHENVFFKCEECPKVFETKKKVNDHLRSHTKCAECSRFFQTRKKLTDHSRLHRKKLCSNCNKVFWASYLQAHMKICKGIQVQGKRENGKFICVICNYETTTQMRLGNHLIRKHNSKPPPKVNHCEFCNYQSEKRCMVRRHEKTCKKKYENIIFI